MKQFLAEMLYALTSAYSRKDYDNHKLGLPLETNIGKLFSIFAQGLDSVQEQAEMIKLWDDLDYACGKVLDRYGANFGVKRISSDDRFYRLAIRVKMMALLSGGDTDTMIRAASALLDVEPSNIQLEDVFPAKIRIYVDKELLHQDHLELIEEIAYAMKRILATGIGMQLYLRTNRTFRSNLTLLHCGYVLSESLVLPASQGRTAKQLLKFSHGAFDETITINHSPPAEQVSTDPQNGAGGTVCHTHIQSKRID